MEMASCLETALRRDRTVVAAALAGVILASWAYILAGAGTAMTAFEMTGFDLGAHPTEPAPWSVGYAVLMFFMWWLMMVAMMLPSAAPVILLHAKVLRRESGAAAPYGATAAFTFGYLAVWAGFSLIAVGAHWALQATALLSAMMASASPALSGGLLVAAGIWQLTPLKHACLRRCRSPIGFLSRHWRGGCLGTFRMGIEHGAFCLGCCWLLMALLFHGGVMNLYWIIGLAAFVLVEKVVPAGPRLGRAIGLVLLASGGVLLADFI